MKKKILGITIIATTAVILPWNISRNSHTVSLNDLALDNIEALASGENNEKHSITTCVTANDFIDIYNKMPQNKSTTDKNRKR